MRTVLPIVGLLALVAATPAAAQVTATATPPTPLTGTVINVDLDASQAPVSGRIPASTTIVVQPGFRFDPKAVAARCTPEQGAAGTCPAKSGIGIVVVTATALGFTVPVELPLFLGAPQQAGDLASVIASGKVLDQQVSGTGRILRTADRGLQVTLATPPEATRIPATLDHITAGLSAKRVVKTKVKVKVRGRKRKRTVRVTHHLITTPKTCGGSWATRADLTFADGSTATLPAPITCLAN